MKLLILDVDGVMTDGTKIYDSAGFVVYKKYCDKDFTAIKLFKAAGVKVCLLSSDIFNKGIAERRNIDFFLSRTDDGVINKEKFIDVFRDKYGCSSGDMIYVGDDIFDLDIMAKVGKAYCPSNAVEEVRQTACVIDRKGGDDMVMALYEFMHRLRLIRQPDLSLVKKLDSEERRG